MSKKPPLPLDERLATAGQLVVRSRIFFDIWWLYVGEQTRPKHLDAMNDFSDFFRFDEHAHFVSFIVHIANLFDDRSKDVISLPKLRQELARGGIFETHKSLDPKDLIAAALPVAKKVNDLRHNLFAHRNAALSYPDVFKQASLTADGLRDLTEHAIRIANALLVSRGLNEVVINELPEKAATRLLEEIR